MRDNKERKTNIILISLSILCLIICLLIIVFNRGVEEKNVVLVKDLQDGESRIISDKTDSLSNTGGTFVYKAEEPEGLLNPDDVFKETNNIIIESNTNGRVDNKINRKEENPLELVEPGTVIDVLKEEAIETDVIEEPTLEELLEEARIKRNSGRQELYKSFALFNQKGDICYSNLLCEDNGAILIPFSVAEDKGDYLKKWEPIYEKYKDTISFIFLNTSFGKLESNSKILQYFESNNINSEYPIYFDDIWNVVDTLKITSNSGYFILNCDSFVYKSNSISVGVDTVEQELNAMLEENKQFKLEDEEIIEEFRKNNIE